LVNSLGRNSPNNVSSVKSTSPTRSNRGSSHNSPNKDIIMESVSPTKSNSSSRPNTNGDPDPSDSDPDNSGNSDPDYSPPMSSMHFPDYSNSGSKYSLSSSRGNTPDDDDGDDDGDESPGHFDFESILSIYKGIWDGLDKPVLRKILLLEFHPDELPQHINQFACKVYHRLKKLGKLKSFTDLRDVLATQFNSITDTEVCVYRKKGGVPKSPSPVISPRGVEIHGKKSWKEQAYIDVLKNYAGPNYYPTMTAHNGALKRGFRQINRTKP
jgi:hypothetical protein